jgi:hypothetical protein
MNAFGLLITQWGPWSHAHGQDTDIPANPARRGAAAAPARITFVTTLLRTLLRGHDEHANHLARQSIRRSYRRHPGGQHAGSVPRSEYTTGRTDRNIGGSP